MKSIKDLREQYDLVTEKEEHDMNKLTQLVRAGLFDAKKLSALKRAMEKPADKMTAQEKRMMINLLDALMSEVLSDKMVYRKIKQDVMMKESKVDKNVAKDVTNIPAVVVLKRKSIRAFPDGQKVGLYYAQTLDKYVTIPFSEIGVGEVNEEIHLDESKVGDFLKGIGRRIANNFTDSANSENSGASTRSKSEPKYYNPMSSKLTTVGIAPKNSNDSESGISPALQSWERQKYRQSLQMQEDVFDYEDRWYGVLGKVTPPLGIPSGGGSRRGRGSIPASKLASDMVLGRVAPKRKPALPPQRKKPDPDRRRDRPLDDPRVIPPRKPSGPPTRKPVRKPEPDKKSPAKEPDKKPPVKEPDKKIDKKQDLAKQPQNNTGTRTDAKSKLGRAAKLAAAAAGLGILASLRGGSSGTNKDQKKYYEPKSSTFKPTIAEPKYQGTDDAVKSLERRLFRKSMTESAELDLDGNLFEINSKAAKKVASLYESLNKKNKKKMIQMMKESDESLRKVISFAIRQ